VRKTGNRTAETGKLIAAQVGKLDFVSLVTFCSDRDMKKLTAFLAVVVAMAGFVFGQDEEEKKPPVTISQALKVGEEGLTEFTGLSEVGQDQAAEYYATAKRITTEQELGQKNLQLVLDLQNWRDVISACRRSPMLIGFITNNGGTMSGHQARRDAVAVEDFLAEISKSLPFPDAHGDAKAGNVIDRTIALIKNLHAPREQKAELSDRVKSAVEVWTNLKHMLDEIPDADAKKIAFFATDPVSWWLMTKEEGEKYDALRSKELGAGSKLKTEN
jgi:hypothetical protein